MRRWPKRLFIVWPLFDYPQIVDPEALGETEGEIRRYVLAPRKKRKGKSK